MAKKFLYANIDITFPDSYTDDDFEGEDLVPPAVAMQEVRKILEAGASVDGFDIETSASGKVTRNNIDADILVDLVEQ